MRQSWRFITRVMGLGASLLLLPAIGYSNGHESEWEDGDFAHDRARRAVSRGEVQPMAQLLEKVRARIPGELVGVEFERHYGLWVYEFKIIDEEGRLREVYVNAESGVILSVEDE